MEVPESLQPEPSYPRGSITGLLRRNRDFRLLFGAMLISFAGDWFLFVALAGLIFNLTHSPGLVAALYAPMTVPFALASFIGGPLSDRLNRQFLMVTADILRAVLTLGFFLVDRPSEIWAVFVLTAAISALNAVFTPAATAAVPNLVDRKDLAAANVVTATLWGTMLAVGASLGGLVVAAFGRETAYLVDAASFLLSAGLVLQIRRAFSQADPSHQEHPGLVRASRETFAYARRDRRVLALLTVKGGFGLGAGAIALLPVLALEAFHAGDRGTGILFGFRGVGIVLGPFLVRPFVRDDDMRTVFWAISAAFAIFGLSYAGAAWMPAVYLAGILVLVGHLGGGMQWTLSTYALQVIVPDRIRGRIFAFDEALISLTIAVSATLAGWAAEFFDVRVVMFGLALVGCVYAVVWTAATSRIRRSFSAARIVDPGGGPGRLSPEGRRGEEQPDRAGRPAAAERLDRPDR